MGVEQILPEGISRHLKDRKVIGNIHCGFTKGRDHAWPTSFLLWWNDWIHGWGERNFVINLSITHGFWCSLPCHPCRQFGWKPGLFSSKGGSRVQALTGGHYAVIVLGSQCWGNFINHLDSGMDKLLRLADDTRLVCWKAQLLFKKTSITWRKRLIETSKLNSHMSTAPG